MAPSKQPADRTWQYSPGPCSFLVATGRVPGITLCMQDSRARCPRTRDQNICRSHQVVGCLSSPTENAEGAACQAASRMCPVPVRDTARSGTQAQRSANTEAKLADELAAEGQPLVTPANTPYASFGPFLNDSWKVKENVHYNRFCQFCLLSKTPRNHLINLFHRQCWFQEQGFLLWLYRVGFYGLRTFQGHRNL